MKIFLKCALSLLIPILLGCGQKHSQEAITGLPVLNQDQYRAQLEVLDQAIEDDPELASNYFRKAELLFQIEDSTARDAIEEALSVDPHRADFYFLKARIDLQRNDREGAYLSCQEAELMGFQNSGFYALFSSLEESRGKNKRALYYINLALAMNDQDYRFLNRKASILKRSDTLTAQKLLYESLEMNPDNVDALLMLSGVYFDQGQSDSAFSYLNQSLKIDPQNNNLQLLLVDYLEEAGDRDSSESILRVLVTKDIDKYFINNKLSKSKLMRNQLDSARYYAEQALKEDPDGFESRLILAQIENSGEHYYRALAIYKGILADDSTQQNAREGMEKLSRKIAYLQKIQAEKEAISELVIPRRLSTKEKKEDQENE